LGIDPDELGGSAYAAALASFALFVVGALFPIFPFLFWSGPNALLLSLLVSVLGLFIIGAAISLMTGKGLVYAGTRQLLVGGAAAALTYGLGRLIGVSLG
jgi:VIT1/CCC1 family predicted Fe2+/Mn2+ transporter